MCRPNLTRAGMAALAMSIVLTTIASAMSLAQSSASSGMFTATADGRILDPSGKIFIAAGINILQSEMAAAPVPTLKKLFPKLSFVRLACWMDSPEYASTQPDTSIISWVNSLTDQHVVVMIESHFAGQFAASSIKLTDEYAWYNSLANTFKANPYVWFESGNELGASGLTAEHANVYKAVRDAGNTTMVIFCVPDGNPVTPPDGPLSTYQSMTNVGWDQHSYSWMYKAGADTDVASVRSMLVSNINYDRDLVHSAAGVMPVVIGEYGNGSSSDKLDVGGAANVAAVLAVTPSYCGSSAWLLYWPGAPNPPGVNPADDLVNQYTCVKTNYGDTVAKGMTAKSRR